MSYSGGAGRTFSKGSSQRKDRKKKQEFHKHKLKFSEEEHLDFEQLKSRVSGTLDKLGHQVFSLEPGGYTFSNWMTSFNLLLDDFETKASPHLPKEYYDARHNLAAELVNPVDTSDIDQEIAKIEREIEGAKLEITELTRNANLKVDENRKIVSQLDSLHGKRVTKENELADASEALSELKKKRSFFSWLKPNAESPMDTAKKKVEFLQDEIDAIDQEIKEMEIHSVDVDDESDDKSTSLKGRLDGLQASLGDWNEKKNERLQLMEKRVVATSELARVITSLKLGATVEERNSDPE